MPKKKTPEIKLLDDKQQCRTYPIFRKWYDEGCEYLLHTPDGQHFTYRNYYDSYWTPVMELIGCSHKPHDPHHTCISMMTRREAINIEYRQKNNR